MRIAVDAMGGDHAPRRPVDGALAAARHLGIGIDLVGRADLIRDELVRHPDAEALDVSVVDAPDVVAMDESADLAPHFTSFDTLSRFIASRTAGA